MSHNYEKKKKKRKGYIANSFYPVSEIVSMLHE